MKFVSLASSSKGNSALISYKDTNILVDCGISKKRIVEALKRFNLTLNDIDCIFITHEHSDHTAALPSILKEHDIKVISQRPTLIKIVSDCRAKNVEVNTDKFVVINAVNPANENTGIKVKDIIIYPLKGCHDVPSLYYKFVLGDTVVAILTDMGKYNDYNVRSLYDVNYLMLESNYDEQLILENSYPAWLKNRIMGDGGHLSNVDCAEMIMEIANDNLKEVYLSHISEDSNSEEAALKFVTQYISDNYSGTQKIPDIKVSSRLDITEIINTDDL